MGKLVSVVLATDRLAHSGQLLLEAVQILEVSVYIVILTISHVLEPLHEICCQCPYLLLIDLLQQHPDPLQIPLPFDVREHGTRYAGADDLLDGRLLLPPTICQV